MLHSSANFDKPKEAFPLQKIMQPDAVSVQDQRFIKKNVYDQILEIIEQTTDCI